MELSLSDVAVRLPGAADLLFRIPSLRIPSGSRMLIHGASGKGKTTFLHLLAGQFPPETGTVAVDGVSWADRTPETRCRLRRGRFGLLFQQHNLLEHLDAVENVLLGFPGRPAAAEKDAARRALIRLGLESRLDRKAGLLSPGERQRAALARILAFPPDVILADEPTSSLDRDNAESVIRALCEAAAGRTLVVVSHDERIRRHFDAVRDFAELTAP